MKAYFLYHYEDDQITSGCSREQSEERTREDKDEDESATVERVLQSSKVGY